MKGNDRAKGAGTVVRGQSARGIWRACSLRTELCVSLLPKVLHFRDLLRQRMGGAP